MRPNVLSASLLFLLPAALAAQATPTARLGILLDGPTDRTAPVEALIMREVATLLSGEFALEVPASARIEGDWSRESVRRGLDALLADTTLDIILAMGAIASNEAALRTDLPVPVIAPFVIVDSLAATPGPNLSVLISPRSIEHDLAVFSEIREPQHLAFLVDGAYLDGVPGMATQFERRVASLGIPVDVVAVRPPVSAVLDQLSGFDAVYISALYSLSNAQFAELVEGVNARGLPSMSRVGTSEVDAGVLMTLTAPNDIERVGRRIALHVQRILLGDAPGSLSTAFARGERLTINMATARRIAVYPPWTVLTEAVLLREEEEAGLRTLSLESVVQEAVGGNYQLQSQEHALAAGQENIRDARSVLLPQLDGTATGAMIDRDRAEASLGSASQRSFTAGATVSQILYSEPARANLAIQRDLQQTRIEARDAIRLDVIEEASTAYANLLRAKTLLRVREDNVRATRSHLELSQVRVSIGASSPGEILRWQSQLASARREVLDARAAVGQAETAVNRVLGRPIGERFATVEPDLADPTLISSDPRLARFTSDPWSFAVFQDFMVEEALATAPELRQIDAAIAAQQRLHDSARRAFWSPTVALQGQLSTLVAEGGAGTDFTAPTLPGGPDLGGLFPSTNDLSWNLGLRVSMPLFTSGGRTADRERSAAELRGLQSDRASVVQGIEQRMRVALHAVGATSPGVELAVEAADAARRSLELVRDAYAQGVVSVVELIDAQSAALGAEEAAAAATYDFLIDLMHVERALGRFTVFLPPGERDAFFERAERFFTERGNPLPIR